MRHVITGIVIGMVVVSTSCKKYLDINTNPNSATTATPELILPQALVNTASAINAYNTYGSQTGLYAANAGGYGGFGESITYNYTTSFTGLWGTTYDNLEDYQAILDKTDGTVKYNYFNAVARIMKAYDFQLLTDAFNDIPFEDALKGASKLAPAYTDGKTIYKSLADELDKAIATINQTSTGVTPLGSSDVLFAGDVKKWKQFANTIKLRLLIRGKGKVTFSNSTFSSDGFLTSDALINPGYVRDNGKQNPAWNTWAYGYTGSDGNKAWMPATFIFSFYDGHILNDAGRGAAIYYKFPGTGTNRLGIENYNVVASPSGSFWFSGTNRDGKSNGSQVGVLKGPNAGLPAMLAAESYFLQAEAVLRGIITGSDETLFYNGITASFKYLYTLPDGSTTASAADSVAAYKANNLSSALVTYSLNTSTEQKVQAIITQKFIALNFIHGHEAWNEYRRTHYPAIVSGGNAYQTFASSVSESPRTDKLPTRILYPTSEGSYNSENVPKSISPFTSLIFWAQ
ncbi:hypothetical protein A3860_26255 [Niastella vici]|uniref:SusD/RagB family nutrient-binding outer membrane lipoprotein n=1 Tax=Niastella vici TaxID=1703345 RepID=A0A1V9FWV2_9BACT|nr:SusD/RagB family nutrient-binding outer membrane lipoprotein [Niastella vici]OQP62817.1 hypothetical protein A3860_26255 [Niastella vici]